MIEMIERQRKTEMEIRRLTVKAPYGFRERFGDLDQHMQREECERALHLTVRQMEIMEGVAYGLVGDELARSLGVSVKTIESHIAHIKVALELDCAAEVRVWAVKYFMAEKFYELKRVEVERRREKFAFVPLSEEAAGGRNDP